VAHCAVLIPVRWVGLLVASASPSDWHPKLTYPAYAGLVPKAECCYHAGEYEDGLESAQEAADLFDCQPGLSKMRALCMKELGDIEEAADAIGREYFYEQPWDKKVAGENLKLWRELDAERAEMRG